MSILKYIDRLKSIDACLRNGSTGDTDQFAKKLGISRSQLFQDLKEMRELGASIKYCTYSKSYRYEDGRGLILSFEKKDSIRGGKNYTPVLLDFVHLHSPLSEKASDRGSRKADRVGNQLVFNIWNKKNQHLKNSQHANCQMKIWLM